MFKPKSERNEELDRLGKVVLRSAVAAEEDVEAAATSPFLFARVRAAIAGEHHLQEEAGGWLSMILVARKAVPAMALVATLAAVLTAWSAGPGFTSTPVASDEGPLFEVSDPGVEQTVLASRNGLSRDEIFNIVVDRNYEVKGK
ncbi:MAG TPA: hypothetical protein VKD91_06695 [Pyrinomonadaceae bacterium]|nr:hypothetical protein [Pyrinomonadaceae bacterium]